MADLAKLQKLIRSLNKLTAQGIVMWTETADENEFQTALPNYAVAVGLNGHQYQILVRDGSGRVLDEANSSDFQALHRATGGDLGTLYEAARRRALSVDAALDDLLLSLEHPA